MDRSARLVLLTVAVTAGVYTALLALIVPQLSGLSGTENHYLADHNGNGIPDLGEDRNGDGICDVYQDKDHDGIADLFDPALQKVAGRSYAQTTEICDDGMDNDGDGAVDMEDSDCAGSPVHGAGTTEATSGSGGAQTVCTDGFDNDGDGAVDGEDPGCSCPTRSPDSESPDSCPTVPGVPTMPKLKK